MGIITITVITVRATLALSVENPNHCVISAGWKGTRTRD